MSTREHVSRRTFLRAAVLGGAVPYILTNSTALGAPGKTPPSDRI